MTAPREAASDLEPEHHFGPGYSATALDQPTAGQSLSAMEVAVGQYRESLKRAGVAGHKVGHRVDGFRDGWQKAVAFMKQGPAR